MARTLLGLDWDYFVMYTYCLVLKHKLYVRNWRLDSGGMVTRSLFFSPKCPHKKKKTLFFCFLLLHVSLIGLLEIGGWVWLVRSIRTQILNLTILTTAHPLFWSCVVSLLCVSNFFFNHALYVSLSRTQLLPTVVVLPVFPGVWDSEAGRLPDFQGLIKNHWEFTSIKE